MKLILTPAEYAEYDRVVRQCVASNGRSPACQAVAVVAEFAGEEIMVSEEGASTREFEQTLYGKNAPSAGASK
jgi:hypothetical protein